MKESIGICAASLCCALVGCSVMRMFAPAGATRRIMSVVISVFMLCCLASPLYSIVKNVDLTDETAEIPELISEDIQSDYDQRVIEITAEYINEYVASILKSANVENPEIETILSKDETGGIYIYALNIHLNGSENVNVNDLEELLRSAVGIVPNISES